MEQIYLDHNATTPADPEVIEAMVPFLGGGFGNASSVHSFGRDAKVALETAREQIAAFINCEPSELYFMSGGTESDNLGLIGAARQLRRRRDHIAIGSTEHHAVLEAAEYLEHKEDFKLGLVSVDKEGFILPAAVDQVVTDNTSVVSIMHANNETGTIQEMAPLADVVHAHGALLHSDMVQSTGKVPVDVKAMGVDLGSITAHKIYGPKGIGALYVRGSVKIAPLLHGGSHEKKRRPGTENVAGAVGFAKALEIAGDRMERDYETISKLADEFIDRLLEVIPDVRLNGPCHNRIPQTVNVAFEGIEGESVVLSLDMEGIAVSSGSACTSGAIEASHVLTAMGVPAEVAMGSVRFSLGRATTRDQIHRVLKVLPPVIERLRAMSPVYNKPR